MKYILLICLFFYNCAAFAQKICIPFESDSLERGIFLNYNIRGIPLKFFFDTGSTFNTLSFETAAKLGIVPDASDSSVSTIFTLGNVPLELHTKGMIEFDDLFHLPTYLVDSQTFLWLHGEKIDGYLGLTFSVSRYVLEFDFKKNHLCFWDSIPENYLSEAVVDTIKMVKPGDDSEYFFFSKVKNPYFDNGYALKTRLVLADSVVYYTNLMLDTGSPEFFSLSVYDSSLMAKMLNYKKEMSEKYGNDYPTIRMSIKKLNIDSIFANVHTLPKYEINRQGASFFGKHLIGGHLGMKFFRQYEKVILDFPNRIAYFVTRSDSPS